jgi:hypothetical protein
MIKKIYGYLLIMTLLITASPLISLGQTTETPGNFLQMTISPENPQPLQSVQVNLYSFSYDLDRSTITWIVNGQDKKTEVGASTFNITAGKNGTKTTIRASVITPNDGTKEISISFIPEEVDLIYESLSYTPPFYKGKALNPKQGTVRVTAIPNLISTSGLKVAAKNIVYTWRKDSSTQGSASGLGKNTFTFTGEIPIRNTRIEVTATAPDNTASAVNSVNIINTTPKIIFYENSPIYGVLYSRAVLGTVKMLTDEFGVVATPYFFSATSTSSTDLRYTWSMNGQTTPNQDPENSFTTKVIKVGSGTANVELEVKNNINIFQKTTSNYNINFMKK